MASFLNAQSVRERMKSRNYDILKYVRMADGSFRFLSVETFREHSSLIDDGETAVSAGTVILKDDCIHWQDTGSYSLDLSGALCGGDEGRLEEMFGMLFAGPY